MVVCERSGGGGERGICRRRRRRPLRLRAVAALVAGRQAVLDHRPCDVGFPTLARGDLAGDPGEGEESRRETLVADLVGIRSDQVTGRTRGERGKTPVVRRSGKRFSVNAMTAISTKGRMHFMVFAESFTAEVMCRFPDQLAGHFESKVHLVVDGTPPTARGKTAPALPPIPTLWSCTSSPRTRPS